jgi:hypothetical protein
MATYLGDKKLNAVLMVETTPQEVIDLIENEPPADYVLPASVKGVRASFFYDITTLVHFDSNNAEEIGSHAFNGCTATSITLTNKVKKIGYRAFANMGKWKYRDFSMVELNKDMANANEHNPNNGFYGCNFGNNTYLPNAFMTLCAHLNTDYLDFSKFVYIGSGAASSHQSYDDPDFKHINISSATTIGASAFYNRAHLEEIIFNPNKTYAIGEQAFSFSSQAQRDKFGDVLTDVYMDKVKTIATRAFRYRQSLKNVYIGADCTSIATTAFEYCTQADLVIRINQPQDNIKGAPWGATNATIVWEG